MKKISFRLIVLLILSFLLPFPALAKKDPSVKKNDSANRKKMAATKKDVKPPIVKKNGGPSPSVQPSKKKPSWQTGPVKAEGPVETRYDADGDGWLAPQENKELLKDKMKIINARGKTKVETAAEREYDLDHNSYIDETEAEPLKKDLS